MKLGYLEMGGGASACGKQTPPVKLRALGHQRLRQEIEGELEVMPLAVKIVKRLEFFRVSHIRGFFADSIVEQGNQAVPGGNFRLLARHPVIGWLAFGSHGFGVEVLTHGSVLLG